MHINFHPVSLEHFSNHAAKQQTSYVDNCREKFSFYFFYKSPTIYNFLRLQKINLPVPLTIRRWIGNFESKFLPGFNGYFFDHDQKKKKLSIRIIKRKHAALVFMKYISKSF
jgi:hypothetical protein